MADISTPSSDYEAMLPYWDLAADIMGGAAAMRAAGDKYLPKFEAESKEAYEFRRKNAKFTNVFRDIVESLAAKPFSKEVTVKDIDKDVEMEAFIEDVDAQGNHLNVFAASLFFEGIKSAIQWVLVDYNGDLQSTQSLAAQKAAGVRPYWVAIEPRRVLAAYTAMIDGKMDFYHVRIKEDTVNVVDGQEEKLERIRVIERPQVGVTYGMPVWRLYEKRIDEVTKKTDWIEVANGVLTIGVIPLVPFITGRRIANSMQFEPSLRDAADLQVELYQQESGLKYAKEATAFPMLAANGIDGRDADGKDITVPVGPKRVLFAPPDINGNHGEWKFIEPSSESLRFLAEDVKETISQLRELGRQPLTAQTGNLTVVTTAFAADKANSVIQAWAINLKDALENCLRFTAMWMNSQFVAEVSVDTDFDIGMSDGKDLDALAKARANGDLSQETYWHELQRRNVLDANFDADEELELLANELPDADTEQDLLDAAGDTQKPVDKAPVAKPNDDNATRDAETAQRTLNEFMAGIKEALNA